MCTYTVVEQREIIGEKFPLLLSSSSPVICLTYTSRLFPPQPSWLLNLSRLQSHKKGEEGLHTHTSVCVCGGGGAVCSCQTFFRAAAAVQQSIQLCSPSALVRERERKLPRYEGEVKPCKGVRNNIIERPGKLFSSWAAQS